MWVKTCAIMGSILYVNTGFEFYSRGYDQQWAGYQEGLSAEKYDKEKIMKIYKDSDGKYIPKVVDHFGAEWFKGYYLGIIRAETPYVSPFHILTWPADWFINKHCFVSSTYMSDMSLKYNKWNHDGHIITQKNVMVDELGLVWSYIKCPSSKEIYFDKAYGKLTDDEFCPI